MKNKIVFLFFFAVISTLISCEKVEEKVYLLDTIIAPEFKETPIDLTLTRDNSDDTLVFIGTLIDPGFPADINYKLLVDKADVDGDKPTSISASPEGQDTLFKYSVADWNSKLKNKSREYESTALNFVLMAEITIDAGTGAKEYIYYSAPETFNVTTFSDPRLDVRDSGSEQSLDEDEDGVFSGTLVLVDSLPFTLVNPETGITYGGSDGTLVIDGPAIVVELGGKHSLVVNTNDMTYVLTRQSSAVMKLIDSGIEQSLMPTDTVGQFFGIVTLSAANSFTLYADETDVSYGGSGGTLAVDGAAITPPGDGYHLLTVNTTDLTYELMAYSVGVVGAFNGWGDDFSDPPMTYDASEGVWAVTMDLPVGPMKFRVNEAWDDRWGPGTNTDLPAEGGFMDLPSGDADINITAAGNYDIELTITGFTQAAGLAAEVVFTLN